MNDSDIAKIEDELEITLPEVYIRRVAPFEVPALCGNTDTELWDHATELIELNRGYRLGRIGCSAWSNRYYVPGQVVGDPSVFVVDLSNETVIWIDHGFLTGEEKPGLPLCHWLDDTLESLRSSCDELGVSHNEAPDMLVAANKKQRTADLTLLTGCAVFSLLLILLFISAIVL